MAETIKETLEDVGHKIADTASKVGHRVGEGVEKAADWAKEKAHEAGHKIEELKGTCESNGSSCCATDIREHMDVYASCGKQVGTVDHVEGETIKLTRSGSPDGQHHRIPLSWVKSVDSGVHLDRNHLQVQGDWQPA